MLAMAQWMFDQGAKSVCICPDGEHAKQFNIFEWLKNEGFSITAKRGRTRDAGTYTRGCQTLDVKFAPGQGDIVANLGDTRVVVEAKGGIINTRHPGQKSRLRRHLYEAVGMLLDNPAQANHRLIVAVPLHPVTKNIAQRMAERCRDVGIEIALISEMGEIQLNTDWCYSGAIKSSEHLS